MCPNRLGPIHRGIDHRLARGIVQMVVATDHMRDPHVMVIDHHCQHISGRAI